MRDYSEIVRNKLRGMNMPVDGWHCLFVEDWEEDDFTCELCGNTKVRFVHHMVNEFTDDQIAVGCICAGAMEGDVEAARLREKPLRNKAQRKRNFPNRKWERARSGSYYLNCPQGRVFINTSRFGGYGVSYQGRQVWNYKGKKIQDFNTACYAAFDLVEGEPSM